MYECCTRAVQVAQPAFVGEYRHVGHFERSGLSHTELRLMLLSGQLLASRDGARVARWTLNPDGTVQVVVGRWVHPAKFRPAQARLLAFDPVIFVSGTSVDGRRGLFRLMSDGGVEHVADVPPIAMMGGEFAIVHDNTDAAEVRRMYGGDVPDGFPVDARSLLTPLADGQMLVLEPMAGAWYRYLISEAAPFGEFYPVPFPYATFVGLARWREMTVVGVRSHVGSSLELLGPASTHFPARRIRVEGELEQLWQSPTERGIAWLTRLSIEGRTHRRLFVNNQLLFQGEFTMNPDDLVWSPDGRTAGAHIRRGFGAVGPSTLVTFHNQVGIRPGRWVDEFIVDNRGETTAWIETDGRYCYPLIHGAPHDAVEIAWNLGVSGHEIHYNCVMSDVIQRVADRTGTRH